MTASVARRDTILALQYGITGDLASLVLPTGSDGRQDGLWRHTCFEAFVRAPEAQRYSEFNFAPPGAWAAYGFDRYRYGMQPLAIAAPDMQWHVFPDAWQLDVAIETRLNEPWMLALSAVIETNDGSTYYWAAHHPPGVPDFHHDDCFVIEVAAWRAS